MEESGTEKGLYRDGGDSRHRGQEAREVERSLMIDEGGEATILQPFLLSSNDTDTLQDTGGGGWFGPRIRYPAPVGVLE